MFERFSDEARQVIVLSQDEARRLRHSVIGTEHLLLGLARVDEPAVGSVLARAGLDLDGLREAIAKLVPADEEEPRDHVPFTPRAKKVLELGLREANRLGSEVIVPGHLLLGMIREGGGLGARVLLDGTGDLKAVQREIERSLRGRTPRITPMSHVRGSRAAADDDRLDRIEARLAAIEAHLARLADRLEDQDGG
ncbi:Clp protease N-terminal domain-containing protein [Actinomadura rupiterrae]|uniref:Clp protease N-terminal domain-containing protein n=1 Tax=Actinomadura rupiterrae TaxID=559627 RepID=UPI0020A3954F|nr:Clp protease N-terminal domain-containing protein [Actinomadura rupiterrae]MCP2337168.1 ATP-dependent Clp protease ATP-binding subunit ClpC [Actinomadura rupiterrae]